MGCMKEYDAQYEVCPYCGYIHGTPPKEAYHITPGSILQGRYIIGRVLGFGGFGITYIAYDHGTPDPGGHQGIYAWGIFNADA